MRADEWEALTGVSVDRVAGITVGAGEIEILDANVRNLNADIGAQLANPRVASFITEMWAPFFVRWEGWMAQHLTLLQQTAIPVLGDPNIAADFTNFVGEYNELRRQWLALGQETSAGRDTALDSPLQKAWNYATTAVGTVGVAAVGLATIYLAYEAYRTSQR